MAERELAEPRPFVLTTFVIWGPVCIDLTTLGSQLDVDFLAVDFNLGEDSSAIEISGNRRLR